MPNAENKPNLLMSSYGGKVFEVELNPRSVPLPALKDMVRLQIVNSSEDNPREVIIGGITVPLLLLRNAHLLRLKEKFYKNEDERKAFFSYLDLALQDADIFIIRSVPKKRKKRPTSF